MVACYRRMRACEDCTIPTLRQMAIKFCRTILVIKSGPSGSNFIVYTNKNYESREKWNRWEFWKTPRIEQFLRILYSLRLSCQESVRLYILDVCALMRYSAAYFWWQHFFLTEIAVSSHNFFDGTPVICLVSSYSKLGTFRLHLVHWRVSCATMTSQKEWCFLWVLCRATVKWEHVKIVLFLRESEWQ